MLVGEKGTSFALAKLSVADRSKLGYGPHATKPYLQSMYDVCAEQADLQDRIDGWLTTYRFLRSAQSGVGLTNRRKLGPPPDNERHSHSKTKDDHVHE